MPEDDHPLAGRYLVYEVCLSPKLSGGMHRFYWQGPDTNSWISGAAARASAPRFPNPTAARAALAAAEGDNPPVRQGQIGYEWEPPTIERPKLPEPEGHPWPTSTCTSSPAS